MIRREMVTTRASVIRAVTGADDFDLASRRCCVGALALTHGEGAALLLERGNSHHTQFALGSLGSFRGVALADSSLPLSVRDALRTGELARLPATSLPVVGAPRSGDIIVAPFGLADLSGAVLVHGARRDDAEGDLLALGWATGWTLCSTGPDRWHRALASGSPEAVVVLSSDMSVAWANDAALEMIGGDAQELRGCPFVDLVHPDDVVEGATLLSRAKSLRGGPVRGDLRVGSPAAGWVDVEIMLGDAHGAADAAVYVASLRDVRERKSLEALLAHRATHDPLTNLANRGRLLERLESAQARISPDHGLAVILVDVDDFKAVNDTLGHPVGDELLVAVAERLGCQTRDGDVVGRLGGDEFVVVLDGVTASDALATAERIRAGITAPFEIGGETVRVTASVGIRFADRPVPSDEMLRDSDLAMYAAKSGGKNAALQYTDELLDRVLADRTMRVDLENAVLEGQFTLHYQPIVDVAAGDLVGFEALLRWHHPVRGLVPPDRFIPVAESTGLIVPIGEWALHEATRAAKRLETAAGRPVRMNVNLSVRQLDEPTFVEVVAEALEAAALDPAMLVLELTESLLATDDPTRIDQLGRLRSLGVGIAIDDFGTGFSSLAYLDHIPASVIKLDRAFVSRLSGEPEGGSLIETIVRIGDALQLVTVAEGVETEAQLEALRSLGCELAQGFYIAHPLPIDEAEGFLAASPFHGRDQMGDVADSSRWCS